MQTGLWKMGIDRETAESIITAHFNNFKNETLWKSKVLFEDDYVEFKPLDSWFAIDRTISYSRLWYGEKNAERTKFVDYFNGGKTHERFILDTSFKAALQTRYPISEFEKFNALRTAVPPSPPFVFTGREAVIARTLRLPLNME